MQGRLMNMGMRIRKSIYDGYKTGKPQTQMQIQPQPPQVQNSSNMQQQTLKPHFSQSPQTPSQNQSLVQAKQTTDMSPPSQPRFAAAQGKKRKITDFFDSAY
ncbi:hypothetical protein HDU85_005409 [Gaertneriomyces sp. JEL0708]|nr:hypothetical protein HDU85_005409 [Gaertneriomyces sp. JEL0708]